jgi:threonine dehydratase
MERTFAPQPELTPRISLQRIAQAVEIIDPVFRNTPQYQSSALSRALGTQLLLKVESVNPIGSFKGRGAEYLLHTLFPRPEHVVAASAGNFGQGVAWAARRRGIRCTIFAAARANSLKVDRMRELGATVILEGEDFDAAKEAARAFAVHTGATFLEDGLAAAVAEGAGTIGLELDGHSSELDAVILPLGNGALLAGVGRYLRASRPETRVIGVCAAAAPAMALSWESGSPVRTAAAVTVADGIAVRVPIPEAVADVRTVTDEVVLVSEESLLEAVRLVFEKENLVAEPAGAAGIAALLEHPRLRLPRTATIIAGSNLAPELRPLLAAPA